MVFAKPLRGGVLRTLEAREVFQEFRGRIQAFLETTVLGGYR